MGDGSICFAQYYLELWPIHSSYAAVKMRAAKTSTSYLADNLLVRDLGLAVPRGSVKPIDHFGSSTMSTIHVASGVEVLNWTRTYSVQVQTKTYTKILGEQFACFRMGSCLLSTLNNCARVQNLRWLLLYNFEFVIEVEFFPTCHRRHFFSAGGLQRWNHLVGKNKALGFRVINPIIKNIPALIRKP